mmetsp:Transcript_4812/g.19293  ORF Transcript_4812/g.19293 Transcript_4812/m.19293 type:complete len:89 (-) Transcript_4812:176-442(-)
MVEADILLHGQSFFASVPARIFSTGVSKNYAERGTRRQKVHMETDEIPDRVFDFDGFFDDAFRSRVAARACEKMNAIRSSPDRAGVCK